MSWRQNWKPLPSVRRDEGCFFGGGESRASGIALFIASDNKARALSFVRELRAKAQQLGDMPRGFPLVPRYEHDGIRRRPFGEYLIFYRVEPDQVVIVHILHGARHYEGLLFAED